MLSSPKAERHGKHGTSETASCVCISNMVFPLWKSPGFPPLAAEPFDADAGKTRKKMSPLRGLVKGPAILLPGKHRNGSGAGCRVSIVSAVQLMASFCFATQIIRSVRSCRPSRKVYFYFYLKHAIMQAIAIDLVKTFFLFLGKAVKQHVQSGAGPVNSWGGL